MAIDGAKVVRVEFHQGKAKKLIPRMRFIQAAVREAAKEFDNPNLTAQDLLTDWAKWPYLIRAMLLEQDSTITHPKACDLMDDYFETHYGDPKAFENLLTALNDALSLYLQIEKTKTEDETIERPTQPASESTTT